MIEDLIEDYNEEEVESFALALSQKARDEALKKGVSLAEAQKIAQEKYNEVEKRHALEFLKKIEEKLDS